MSQFATLTPQVPFSREERLKSHDGILRYKPVDGHFVHGSGREP
ncbi:MAG: hypothetical protein ACKOCN_11715 [Planctomycetaceae bacterium]